jgi:O-antigen/teichoic acid export membrane protein
MRASRRIAVGALARSVGEIVAKVASLVLYIAIARELGDELFGEFFFALSLSTLLTVAAGLGFQGLLAREIAKDGREVDSLFWNVFALKATVLVPLLVIVGGVAAARGVPLEIAAAIVVIAISVGLDYQASTYFAVFQGLERNHHVATSLIVNRISTMAMGLAVLAAGGGLLAVAAVVALGSLFGVIIAHGLMRRYVVRPAFRVEPGRWPDLIRIAFPLGLVTILNQALLRLNAVFLGFLAASSAVGDYGAASRLIEATMFVPWAFGPAILPWFSRHTGEDEISIARGYEMALKAMVALMLPVAAVFVIFAEPLIDLLYGAEFDGAVSQLQILGIMTVLYGLNAVTTVLLIARDRPGEFTKPAGAVLVAAIALNLILIPPYGGDGAAIALVLSSALLLAVVFRNVARLFGRISPLRPWLAPAAAAAVLFIVTELLDDAGWLAAAGASLAAYAAVFLVVERALYPNDFRIYAGLLKSRGVTPASPETPAQ